MSPTSIKLTGSTAGWVKEADACICFGNEYSFGQIQAWFRCRQRSVNRRYYTTISKMYWSSTTSWKRKPDLRPVRFILPRYKKGCHNWHWHCRRGFDILGHDHQKHTGVRTPSTRSTIWLLSVHKKTFIDWTLANGYLRQPSMSVVNSPGRTEHHSVSGVDRCESKTRGSCRIHQGLSSTKRCTHPCQRHAMDRGILDRWRSQLQLNGGF